jgi:hypothetical protein
VQASKTIHYSQPILLCQFLNEKRLLLVDASTTIRYVDLESFDLLGGFKVNIQHPRHTSKVLAFSADGAYFATITSDAKESRLYDTKAKKAIARVTRHQGEVSCVAIDPKHKYMFSGGEDGRTFVVDIQSGQLALTLPHHADTINDIAFSPNGEWVATASYDKTISLFHLALMTPKHKLKGHSKAVMKVLFLDKERLLSIDKQNSAIIWDLKHDRVLCRLQGIHDDVTQVLYEPTHSLLFLGTKLGYVLVYDMQNYQLISGKFIKLSASITSLALDQLSKRLFIATDSGEFLVYELFYGEEENQVYLQDQSYEKIEKSLGFNPLLRCTQSYELLQTLWEKALKKATEFLEVGDTNGAKKLLDPFMEIGSKKKVAQELFTSYKDFKKFIALTEQNKIALAYSMANSNPLYKKSQLYANLEKNWKKCLALAHKYALDPKEGIEKARDVLSPYRGVSEKTKIIKELMTQASVYQRFRASIAKKDFVIVFSLVKQHPYLKEFADYDALLAYSDSLYIQANRYLQADETHLALKLFRILKFFPDFTQESNEIMAFIETKQKFFNAIENKDLVLAYTLLDTYEELQETPDGMKLQKLWNEDIVDAYYHATQGDIEGVERRISVYKQISSKYRYIATLIAWCYMVQLENAMREKQEMQTIENGIKKFVLQFGLQDQIISFYELFLQEYTHSKLRLEAIPHGTLRLWKPSMIVKSILD